MKSRLAILAAAFVLAFIPQVASAELWIYCGGLPGCPSGFTERFSTALTELLVRLPNYAYILGVLFIMIGGLYMVISSGDAEKVTKGKNTIIWATIGIFVMQFSQDIVNLVIVAETSTLTGPASDLVQNIVVTLIEDILILIYIICLIVAVLSGMRMVLAFGKEEEFKKGKDGLFWAAVGAIVINLAQAIANVFCLAVPGVCFLP